MAAPDDDLGREPDGEDSTPGHEPGVVSVGRPRTPISQQVGRVTMTAAAAVFVLFALFNAQPVDFSWVFGSTEVVQVGGERVSGGVPLILLLGGAFVLGVIVGLGAAVRRRRG